MDITFVLPATSVTGGVRVVYEYADRLTDRGHDVTILAPVVPPHPVSLLRQTGVLSAIRKVLGSSRVEWETDTAVESVPALSPTFVDAHLEDADVVIATEWRTAPPVAASSVPDERVVHLLQHYEVWDAWNSTNCWRQAERIASREGTDAVLAMADVQPERRTVRRRKRRVDEALELPLRKVVVSGWLERLLERRFDQEVAGRIRNGVNQETFYPDGEDDGRTVLAPYRDVPWKGANDAVEAFRTVRDQTEGVRFKMFGPVERNVPDWIEYYARPTDSELRALYSSASTFAFPSWVEGFGLPPMEAMACGTAVVASNVGAVPDYGTPGEDIMTVPPRDPRALADTIISLLSDDERRLALATAGRKRAETFSWGTATDEMETLLQEVADA